MRCAQLGSPASVREEGVFLYRHAIPADECLEQPPAASQHACHASIWLAGVVHTEAVKSRNRYEMQCVNRVNSHRKWPNFACNVYLISAASLTGMRWNELANMF